MNDELAGRIRLMHKQKIGFWAISRRFGISMTEVRRVIDPKAAEAHDRWRCGGR